METRDLARMRAQSMTRRPAEVTRAEPYALTAVRALPRAVAVPHPTRWQRFTRWRRNHYAADQALRVAAILAAGATLIGVSVLGIAWALHAAQLGAGIVVALLILAIGATRRARPNRHPDGYGFHWTKCE